MGNRSTKLNRVVTLISDDHNSMIPKEKLRKIALVNSNIIFLVDTKKYIYSKTVTIEKIKFAGIYLNKSIYEIYFIEENSRYYYVDNCDYNFKQSIINAGIIPKKYKHVIIETNSNLHKFNTSLLSDSPIKVKVMVCKDPDSKYYCQDFGIIIE